MSTKSRQGIEKQVDCLLFIPVKDIGKEYRVHFIGMLSKLVSPSKVVKEFLRRLSILIVRRMS